MIMVIDKKDPNEITKRILEASDLGFNFSDAKSSKGVQKLPRKLPKLTRTEKNDYKEKRWNDIEDLPAEDAIKRIKEDLENVSDKKDEIDLWIKLGEKLYYIRKDEEAIYSFKAALVRDPKNKTALKKLGWCYQSLNKYFDARECANRIIKNDDKNIDALEDYAYCSLKLDDYKMAKDYFLKVYDIDKRLPNVTDNLGYINYKTNNYDEAIEWFEKTILLERKPEDNFAERYLARCFFSQEKDEKCEKLLDILIQKDVSDWYIFYMKAELLVIKKEFKKAIVHYKTSIRKSEQRLNVFGLGRCYAFLDNIDFAILYYEKSIKLSKIKASITLVNIAACYREKVPPNNKKCIKLCDKALEYDNNYTRALVIKLKAFQELGELKNAVESVDDFEKKAGKSVDSPHVIYELLDIYYELEKHDELLECANKLIKLEDSAESQAWKAFALSKNAKNDEALEVYEKIIEKWPEVEQTYTLKANLLVENYPERLEEAVENYQKSLDLWKKQENVDEKLHEIYLKIGKAIKEMGNVISKDKGFDDEDRRIKMNEALKQLDLAIDYINNSYEAWFQKGNCYWNLRNYPKAFECYEKAIFINPKKIACWVSLGETTTMLRSNSEAKYFFEKAILISNKKLSRNENLQKNNSKREYDWVDAEIGLINCLYNEKKYHDVISETGKILKLSKERGETDVYWKRAQSFSQLEKYSEAIDVWNMAIKDFPSNKPFLKDVLYNACIDSDYRGFEKDADDYAKRLIELGSADGYELQARFLVKNKLYEKAIKLLEENFANFSKHSKKQALRHFIRCYKKIGNKEKKEECEKRLKELEEE